MKKNENLKISKIQVRNIVLKSQKKLRITASSGNTSSAHSRSRSSSSYSESLFNPKQPHVSDIKRKKEPEAEFPGNEALAKKNTYDRFFC